MRTLKAEVLLVQNLRALLAARNVDAAALAFAVGHSQAWISKILSGDRKMKLADMDAIADFFGLTVAQLLQHGTGAITERRRRDRRAGDRRSGQDRRQQTQAERAAPRLAMPAAPKTTANIPTQLDPLRLRFLEP